MILPLLWLYSSLNGVGSRVRTISFSTIIHLAYTLESVCALWVGGVGSMVRTISLKTVVGLLYTLESVSAREESKCCWRNAISYKYHQSYCYYSNKTVLSYHYKLSCIVL